MEGGKGAGVGWRGVKGEGHRDIGNSVNNLKKN